MDDNQIEHLINRINSLEYSLSLVDQKLTRVLSKRIAIRDLFLRALSTALGATVGIAIVLLVLKWLVDNLDIPVFQHIAEEIAKYMPKQ